MKKDFFTGLIILLPVALTLVIIIFLFHFFTAPFLPFISFMLQFIEDQFAFSIPFGLDVFLARLIALVVVAFFVLILGMIARWFLVRNFLSAMNAVFSNIPFIKTIFKVSRDVFSALLSQEGKKAFKHPVMIPFPDQPNHSIGFAVGEVPDECQRKTPEKLVAVFAPTAPHPISGFVLLVPEREVYSLDMTNEDAVKFLVSCGMIVPENHDKN